MSKLSVQDWIESHNLSKDINYVYCICDDFSPDFIKGQTYKIINAKKKYIKSSTLRLINSKVFDIMFIPLTGSFANLSIRDKLMIKIRT
jgi:hypothetical protein